MANSEDARTKVTSKSGRLLWVRRRNGAWWPGQILSIDQVPKSWISSRRSGTPVKLLGKEDASVEFDELIEKAKACTESLSKLPARYARRNDAILQALQLESAQKSEDKQEHEIGELSSPLVPGEEIDHKVKESSRSRGNSNLGHELSDDTVLSEDPSPKEQFSRKRKINFLIDLNKIPQPEDKEISLNSSDHATNALLISSLPEGTNSDMVNRLFEEQAVRTHLPGFTSMHASGTQVEAQSLGPEDFNDSGPTTLGAAATVILGTSLETGKIKWNLKGKRNKRNTNKNRKHAFENDVDLKNKPGWYLEGLEPRDVDAESYPLSKSHVGGTCNPVSNLFNVDVKAQTSCISQTVPFIRLKSGLGHYIVGHPLDVEVLHNGFRDKLITGLPKVQRTRSARRKVRRVSSSIASKRKSVQKRIPEVDNIKEPSVHCVPVNLIFSRLNEAFI